MKTIGLDFFVTNTDEHKSMNCKVCSSAMVAERNVHVNQWANESFASYHPPLNVSYDECRFGFGERDIFTCPFTNEKWHSDVIDLMKEQGNTCSKRIRALIQEDINEILLYRKKEV
jgi:hypothetical protein